MLALKMPKSSCLDGLLWSRESFEESSISDLESPSNLQVKEDKLSRTDGRTDGLTLNVEKLRF